MLCTVEHINSNNLTVVTTCISSNFPSRKDFPVMHHRQHCGLCNIYWMCSFKHEWHSHITTGDDGVGDLGCQKFRCCDTICIPHQIWAALHNRTRVRRLELLQVEWLGAAAVLMNMRWLVWAARVAASWSSAREHAQGS